MKIDFDKKAEDLFEKICLRRDDSLTASDFYNAFLQENYADLTSLDLKTMSKENGISLSQAYFSCLLQDIGATISDLGTSLRNNRLEIVHELDSKAYSCNAYLKNVNPLKAKQGSLSLIKNTFLPYEGFIYKDVEASKADYYSEINHLGFFSQSFDYLELVDKERIWMSITPYEIETMKSSIAKAKGKVVTFGLGLGYFAYMCLQKEDVDEVTVIDNNETIINLFNKNIYPFFNHKNKFNIIKADAYSFLKSKDIQKYDYLFIDLYHDENDGLPFYLNMKKEIPSSLNYDFWIENSFIVYIRRIMIALIEECLDGSKDSDYLNPKSIEDKLFSGIYDLTKDVELKDSDSLLEFLSDDNIRNIAKKWSLAL